MGKFPFFRLRIRHKVEGAGTVVGWRTLKGETFGKGMLTRGFVRVHFDDVPIGRKGPGVRVRQRQEWNVEMKTLELEKPYANNGLFGNPPRKVS